MNARSNGVKIERIIIDRFGFEEDSIGFDASFDAKPIEIKGCLPYHRNGINSYGSDRLTKGRFWIDNRAHRLLVKEDGLYVFVLYEELNNALLILKMASYTAISLNSMIGGGKNTKIRWDRILKETDRWYPE